MQVPFVLATGSQPLYHHLGCVSHGGVTKTGPDATHPAAICQNLVGKGGGYGGGGGLLDHHAISSLQQLLKVKCRYGVSLGCTEQNKDQTHGTPFN